MSSWPSVAYGHWLCHDYDQVDVLSGRGAVLHQLPKAAPNGGGHARTMAQERRRQENEEFRRLSTLLPVARAISEKHLDKATVVRLAGTYIRLHQAVHCFKTRMGSPLPQLDASIIDVLEGFILCLSFDGDILYVSETVSLHLGLSQVEMCGHSVWAYIHPEDVLCLRTRLGQIHSGLCSDLYQNLRIKSTLTKRRNKESPRCAAGYKVVSIEVHSRLDHAVLAFCQPHTARIGHGIRLLPDSIVISTDPGLRIRYVDMQCQNPFQLCSGASMYELVHPDDLPYLVDMYNQLHCLGSCRTPLLRLQVCHELLHVEITAIKYTQNKQNDADETRTTMVLNVIDHTYLD